MNKKGTKRTLMTSLLMLLLSCSMFVGSTFAWFTDEVVSSNNVIQSGTLDIVLEKWDGENWTDASTTPIFNYDKWEPGYTEVVNLRVVNLGTLALKWEATITAEKELSILADVINVYVRSDDQNDTVKDYISQITDRSLFDSLAEEGQFKKFTLRQFIENLTVMTKGSLLPAQESYLGIVLQMDTAAGNEYQGLDLGGNFELKILATQETYESDSFDDQYDANVPVPGNFKITTEPELDEAMMNGGNGVVLNDISEVSSELGKGTTLDLNLNGNALTGATGVNPINNLGTLSLSGGEINSDFRSIRNEGTLVLDNVNLNTAGVNYAIMTLGGNLVLSGGTITADRGGITAQGGTIEVNGTKFDIDGYSNKVGYGVYAASETAVEVVINDAEFKYNQKYTKYSVFYAGKNATIIVNSGKFGKGGSGHKSSNYIKTGDNGTIIIYGGTFEFDPSKYVAEGYEAVKGTDNWWTVSQVSGE